MDINEITTTEDLWTPYKELLCVVDSYLSGDSGGAPYAVHTFEAVLRRHKQTLLSVLTHPVKNAVSREEIKRGITAGVNLPSIGRTILSKELVDEAIIISDMYNVNEYLALELLHTAQGQAPRHPGLPRGLVAVLLYYDGRRALVQALRELVTTREGVCWSISAREDIVKYVTRYVDQLISDGLLGNTLDALRRCSLTTELELLQNNRALPPRSHHAKLAHTIEETRKSLAGVIFAAAAQRGLERDVLLQLLAEQTTNPSQGPTGALDEISLALQMALLYALDLSVLHRREDGEELAKKLPLIQDPDLISVLLDELLPRSRSKKAEGRRRAGAGALALCQLSLGLALAALKRAPQSTVREGRELLDQDEALVDAAIAGKVFEYIDEAILSTEFVAKEEYYQRRIHSLITDFIVLMHSKLSEIRVKADEAARAIQMYAAEGLAPPASAGQNRSRLEALLRCVEKLYQHDPLDLRRDYWLAEEQPPHSHAHSTAYRSGGRAAALYKFVRLSGELVCAPLLPGYLRALSSLAVPRHTWALLSRRDALSAHHLLTALARYHSNLRTDLAPFAEHMYSSSLGASAVATPAARPSKMLVRHEEVEAMIAALKLITSVAQQDSAACAAICENLQWDAVNTMFGLMCCHIPIYLKAELCSCLAALGATAATAGRVWLGLEAAQLVGASDDKRALAAELHEVETRIEEYPLTVSFLGLLVALCEAAPWPRALGAGSRAAGLAPYVTYVCARVALPAPNRPYKRPKQKHQVLSLCYKLFSIWLDQYEPSPSDFPPLGREATVNPPPGFMILTQLHTKTDLLRLVLSTLDEAAVLLDKQPQGTEEYLVESATSALHVLERALALQRALSASCAEAGRSVVYLGLSNLILETEDPETGDRLMSCCHILQHTAKRARCAAAAARLLARVLRDPAAARHLRAAQQMRARTRLDIRHCFVECLEAEESEETREDIRECKENVVAILEQCLPMAPPNLSHYLLGYQADQVNRSALHEPGVGGYPRTCLHAVLDTLEAHVAGHDAGDREADKLIESCYRLVYYLCVRPDTSPPALRLLRSRDHFLSRHVRAPRHKGMSLSTLQAQSWVLRACACEAGAAHASRQHAAFAALLHTLTGGQHEECEWEGSLLRRCLVSATVCVEAPAEPRWELFRADQLAGAVDTCDLPAGEGGKRISVSRVHALLARELAALQVTAPQRTLVANEIQKVLDYVTEINKRRNLAATLTHYYDSWRQLTEIIFCVVPQDILDIETKKNLILNVLQDLLNKIPPSEVLPQIGNLASGTVLLLLVNLRHCYILQKREWNLKSVDFETTFFGPSTQIMQTKSLSLKFILHKILSWILVSGDSTQKMRVNLYGALLNFLNIVNLKRSTAEPEDDEATYVSRLDRSRARPDKEESSLKAMVIEVISSFGGKLCSIVCADCIGASHDACRMVALACLDTLVDIDPHTAWINTLTDQGYLRNLVDSLIQDDEGLRDALEPNPKSLRVLYLYESKMALLIKIAGSQSGAASVLGQGALSCLAELTVLGAHPDTHAPDNKGELLPGQGDRYRQILMPVLSLCDALLNTLGTNNHSCVLHIKNLLYGHIECVDMILRAAHPDSPAGLLSEVEAMTSVLARCSSCPAFAEDDAIAQHKECAQRVQMLTSALLARMAHPPADNTDQTQYYKIVCNLLAFARNTVQAVERGAVEGRHAVLPPHGALLHLLQTVVRRAHCHLKTHSVAAHPENHCVKSIMASDTVEVSCAPAGSLQQLQLCLHAVTAALHLLWSSARLAYRTAPDKAYMNLSWQQSPGAAAPELRQELSAVFSDRFTESLLDTAENHSTQRGFLDVIVKDIKTMMQF